MRRRSLAHRVAAKVILVAAIGAVSGVAYHRSSVADYERSQTITLEEYTADFDAYRAGLAEEQYPLWGTMALMIFAVLALFGAYELLAAGLGWALALVLPARAAPPTDLDDAEPAGPFRAAVRTSRFHSNLGKLAIGGGVVLVAFLGLAVLLSSRTYEVPEGTEIFGFLEGPWTWSGADSACVTEPHVISFTPDRSQMIISHPAPVEGPDGRSDSVTRYDLIEVTRGRVRGAIRGERRLTEGGEPVVWDLVLRGPDRYAWRRADISSPFGYTRDVVRCPPPAAPLPEPVP